MQNAVPEKRRSSSRPLCGALFATLLLCTQRPAAHGQTPLPAAAPPSATSAPSLDFDALVSHAQEHVRSQRYQAALTDLSAAYQLRQLPGLLLALARTQASLGLAAEAITSYRGFLIAESAPTPEQQAEAEQAIARLGALLPQADLRARPLAAPPLAPQIPMRFERRSSHRGMLIAGWSMLSIGYAIACIGGIGGGITWQRFRDGAPPPSDSDRFRDPHPAGGYTLLIPLAGPLVSAIVMPSSTRPQPAWGMGMVWSLPWVLIDLPLQVVGLGLILQGRRTPQVRKIPIITDLAFRPYSTADGVGLVTMGRF